MEIERRSPLHKALLQIYHLFMMSVREFIREPEVLFWAFVFPIGLALTLGLAFDLERKVRYPVGIVENGREQTLMKLLQNHSQLDVMIVRKEEIENALKRRKILLYMEVEDRIRIYYDPDEQDSKQSLIFVYQALNSSPEVHTLSIKGTRYLDFLIPGLIAMGIMNSALWGIGWFLIQMRIKKLLKVFSISPVEKDYFFIAFVLARGLLSVLENLALVLVIGFFFPVTFEGSFLDLALVYTTGYLSFSGIAILASSRAANTAVANGIMNGITIPMTLLSGIFFSYSYFPEELVLLITYLPLTLLTDLLRGIFIEGLTFTEYGGKLLILVLEGSVSYFFGKKYFLWK